MQSLKRVLLIGLGRWGANHLRVLKSLPVELFVADQDPKRLESSGVAEDHRGLDPRAFLSKIEAAVVDTPAEAHFETCRDLLAVGKDVFVEKPITLISRDAKELSMLAEKPGLILQGGHIFRFDPA